MRHISMTRTINKTTGERRYFLDGQRVTLERFELTEITAERIEGIYSTETKTTQRDHKSARGSFYASIRD